MEIVSWDPQHKIVFFRKNEILYKARLLSTSDMQNTLVLYLFNTNQIITVQEAKQEKLRTSSNKKQSQLQPQDKIKSPICGRIITVHVKPEQIVPASSPLVTIESMKMENEILAPFDLFVKNVSIANGDLVKQDHVLLTVKKQTEKG